MQVCRSWSHPFPHRAAYRRCTSSPQLARPLCAKSSTQSLSCWDTRAGSRPQSQAQRRPRRRAWHGPGPNQVCRTCQPRAHAGSLRRQVALARRRASRANPGCLRTPRRSGWVAQSWSERPRTLRCGGCSQRRPGRAERLSRSRRGRASQEIGPGTPPSVPRAIDRARAYPAPTGPPQTWAVPSINLIHSPARVHDPAVWAAPAARPGPYSRAESRDPIASSSGLRR